MKKLNSNIQLAKYIMALLIIFYHDSTAFGLENNVFMLPIIASSMTVFALINGYLKVDSSNYNFLNLLLVVLFCLFVNTLICLLLGNYINVLSSVQHLYFGGRDWWYIWCYLFMQPLIRYLNYFVNKANCFFLTITILFFLYVNIHVEKFLIYGQIFSIFNLFYLINFYLIGAWVKKYFVLQEHKKLLVSFFIFGITYLLITLHNINNPEDKLATTTNNYYTYFVAISMFLIIVSVPSYSNRFINLLGELSLSIYLFHYIVQIGYMQLVDKNEIVYSDIYFIQTLIHALIIFTTTTMFCIPINMASKKFSTYSSIFIQWSWNKFLTKK